MSKDIQEQKYLEQWTEYHLSRMEAVKEVGDMATLMKFGETCVRRTFDGMDHDKVFAALMKAREKRAKFQQSVKKKPSTGFKP